MDSHRFFPDMPLFVEVAKRKSFTQAAERLGLGISTLSRRIKNLEQALGIPLFVRDTHKVDLTAAGELLLEHFAYIINASEDAFAALARNEQSPAGRVRVCMYADTYHESLQGVLSAFTSKWPDIHLSVDFSEESAAPVSAPYDVSFCIGPFPDSPAFARRVYTIRPAVYASPRLLEKHGTPQSPQDLLKLPCICLARFGNIWELRRGARLETVHTAPNFVFASALLVREFALAGHGVALLRDRLAEPLLGTGQLVRLLPDWDGPRHDIYALSPGKEMPRRVRIFIDYISDWFAGTGGAV